MPLLLGSIGMIIAGLLKTSTAITDNISDSLGVEGANAHKIISELRSKKYFTTEEAMWLLDISKPTILRKFKIWKDNPDSKLGLAYVDLGGRNGFRISREAINTYANNHGTAVNWERLAEVYLNRQEAEERKNTGLSKEQLTLHKIEIDKIMKQKAELEIEYLELEAEAEKGQEELKDYRKKILEKKMQINNIEYEIKLLQLSLENGTDLNPR